MMDNWRIYRSCSISEVQTFYQQYGCVPTECEELYLHDWRYVYSLHVKNSSVFLRSRETLAHIVPDFYGSGIAAVSILSLPNSLGGSELEELIRRIKNDISKEVVVRDIFSSVSEELRDRRLVAMGTLVGAGVQVIPEYLESEEAYPEVVYELRGLESILSDCESEGFGAIGRCSTVGKILRYMARRCEKKYRELVVDDQFMYEKYAKVVLAWQAQVMPVSNSEDRAFFSRFWANPIWKFIELMSESSEFLANIVCRHYLDKGTGCGGFWVAGKNGDCLNVFIFLSNRKHPLFADVLLIDLLAVGIRLGCRRINLGGSEKEELFKFKKKYLSSLSGSRLLAKTNLVVQ